MRRRNSQADPTWNRPLPTAAVASSRAALEVDLLSGASEEPSTGEQRAVVVLVQDAAVRRHVIRALQASAWPFRLHLHEAHNWTSVADSLAPKADLILTDGGPLLLARVQAWEKQQAETSGVRVALLELVADAQATASEARSGVQVLHVPFQEARLIEVVGALLST